MSSKQTLTSTVTDTNGHSLGMMETQIEFLNNQPYEITHAGQTFYATGKTGEHIVSKSRTLEAATDQDARLWITLDGLQIWED
jgi:hypothetical protein